MKRRLKNARAISARVLTDIIINGQSLDSALAQVDQYAVKLEQRDRGLVQEISYGCMRWYIQLDALVSELLQRPLKKKDQDVRLLIIAGLYQILHLETRPHAAVAETVAATTDLGKAWAKALVNACLRNFLRLQQELLGKISADDPDIGFSHPRWLLERLQNSYPQQWRTIAEANNRRPPMHLRVNLLRTGREAMLERLRQAGIAASALPVPCGIGLLNPAPVDALPGFNEGVISVQDLSAQYAAVFLDPLAGDLVLDACAAPGGKTCHLLEHNGGRARVIALEIDPRRAQRIEQNTARLGLSAEIRIADALDVGAWWHGEQFDRILLDAPCSATGVIRRHPDIKHHRRPSDIDVLAGIQRDLLDALWPLLRQGGKLLYATCSVLSQENEDQIEYFLDRHTDAKESPLPRGGDVGRAHGIQLLPAEGDGFYYCLLEKN